MKNLFTFLILLISSSTFSQFNRTFLHSTISSGVATFSNYSYYDAQNKANLASLTKVGLNQVQLVNERISDSGELEAFDSYNYSVVLTGSVQQSLLLGVIEQGTERYCVLGAGTASSMKLVWLKINKNNGTLISSFTSLFDYKTSYFEPKLVGNELVTYAVKNNGSLVRVALNTGTFTAPTEELVSASITASTSFPNMLLGFKSGNLFVVNGSEKVVWGGGVSSATIFTRTAANTFTTQNTGISTNRSVSSFLIDPTTIGVSNGINIEHYDAAGTLTNSGNFSWPANSNVSHIEYRNNRYHLYFRYMTSSKGIFFVTDQAFQILDSLRTNVLIYHISKAPNGLILVGSDSNPKGVSLDLNGNQNAGQTAYYELYSTSPALKYDEYATELKSGQHFNASIGLGTKVITAPYGLPGSTYKGISACYSLNDHFVGFTGTGDTISNAESSYDAQYDELPGPYTASALYNEVLEAKYNRPYRVSRKMIEDHIDSVQFGSSNYVPVWEIRNWPAHGNTALGQAPNLAPFTDVNSNGIYEPLLGEYPTIFGNDCVYSITHYRNNGSVNKALEFHSFVYTQACDSTEIFDNVLMRKVQVYSRGSVVDSLFFGGRFDGDLGNYNDDYAGTNVDLGLVYNYNGDLNDEPNAGRYGFGDTLGAQGLMILKGFKQANDGIDNGIGILPGQSVNGYGFNDGIIDNEYSGLYASTVFSGVNSPVSVSDPTNALQWYNMLNGYFRFGETMFYGGSGYPGAPGVTTIPTKYMYTGEDTSHFGTGGVDPGFDWYEFEPVGAGSLPNSKGDRRGGYSFGKVALNSGEFVELDYAYLFKRQSAPVTTIFEPVTDLFAKASGVRSAFLSNQGPCGINFDPIPVDLGVDETEKSPLAFGVYPNPTNGIVRITNVSNSGGTIQVFDINGKLLKTVESYQSLQPLDLSELDGQFFILKISDDQKTEQKRVLMVSSN
ncbi:hypothetical protein D3C71_412490 [compost metagenome]